MTCTKSQSGEDKRLTQNQRMPYYIGVSLLVFSVAGIYVSLTFDQVPEVLKRGMQPETFPQLLLALIALLAVCMMVEAYRKPWPVQTRLPFVLYMSIFAGVVFTVATVFIDFFIGLSLFAIIIAIVWGEKRPLYVALVAIVFPVFVGIFFNTVLSMRFPRGMIVNLFY